MPKTETVVLCEHRWSEHSDGNNHFWFTCSICGAYNKEYDVEFNPEVIIGRIVTREVGDEPK